MLFLVLEQMHLHSDLLYDLTLFFFTGLSVHSCMIGNASSNQVSTMLQFLLYSPTLGTRLASWLVRFLCDTEALIHTVKILATVSQMISVLA